MSPGTCRRPTRRRVRPPRRPWSRPTWPGRAPRCPAAGPAGRSTLAARVEEPCCRRQSASGPRRRRCPTNRGARQCSRSPKKHRDFFWGGGPFLDAPVGRTAGLRRFIHRPTRPGSMLKPPPAHLHHALIVCARTHAPTPQTARMHAAPPPKADRKEGLRAASRYRI
eukprot:scaffold1970_cov114-Isochrysis_galbana.AAC.2